ncbi:MAG: ribbon-helix-helix protein, CopG family [Opitutaceae bacterium]|jgi:hypothetical protein|nr:ribbon-helix-helix protein, CopG family [Opitutaceae bacterium]
MPVSLRLSEPLAGEVRLAAKRLTLGRSAVIRLAIQRGLPIVMKGLSVSDRPVPAQDELQFGERRAS